MSGLVLVYRSTFLISATYFGTMVGRCQSFHGIVVTVVECEGQRLYHRKENCLVLLLVPCFWIARVCSEIQPFPVCATYFGAMDVKVFTIETPYHLDCLFSNRQKIVIHCYLLKPLLINRAHSDDYPTGLQIISISRVAEPLSPLCRLRTDLQSRQPDLVPPLHDGNLHDE